MTIKFSRPGSRRAQYEYRSESRGVRRGWLKRLGGLSWVAVTVSLTLAFNLTGCSHFFALSSRARSSEASALTSGGTGGTSRTVYPYSVIPGGAHSAEELREALKNDRIAAAHYASFNQSAARMIVASKPRPMYSSYRKDGAIYWTQHPLHIAAGEALITDGVNLARARCGNRLSQARQAPTNAEEPSEAEMDRAAPATRELAGVIDSGAPDAAHSRLALEIFPPWSDTVDIDGKPGAELMQGGQSAGPGTVRRVSSGQAWGVGPGVSGLPPIASGASFPWANAGLIIEESPPNGTGSSGSSFPTSVPLQSGGENALAVWNRLQLELESLSIPPGSPPVELARTSATYPAGLGENGLQAIGESSVPPWPVFQSTLSMAAASPGDWDFSSNASLAGAPADSTMPAPAIPEPMPVVLAGAGLVGIWLGRRMVRTHRADAGG